MKLKAYRRLYCVAGIAALFLAMGTAGARAAQDTAAERNTGTAQNTAAAQDAAAKRNVAAKRNAAAEQNTAAGEDAPGQNDNTMYGIGSTSKVITAAAVMKLCEEGKVDLDEPLTNYIPEFFMEDPGYASITPRMLLNHSSGISGSCLKNALLMGDADTYVHDTLMEQLKTQRLKAEPGEFSAYCNDGFTLAEILVERVSGLSFTNYLEENFAAPLALENFKTPQSDFDRDRLAPVYHSGSGYKLPPESANVTGSGGMYSSAEDLCKLSQIFMEKQGGAAGILSPESVKAMGEKEYERGAFGPSGDSVAAYGLGWDSVDTFPFNRYGVKAVAKGGDTEFYHSNLTVLPEENISCAVITSGGSGSLAQLAAQEVLLAYLDEIGRIEREEQTLSYAASEETDAAQPEKLPEKMPEKLPEEMSEKLPAKLPAKMLRYEGWYGGAVFYHVSFTQEGTMLLKSAGDEYDAVQEYVYEQDGSFHSTKGNYISMSGSLVHGGNGTIGSSRVSFGEEKNGGIYLEGSTYESKPGLGQIAVTVPIARKMDLKVSAEAAVDAWEDRSSREYFLVSEKYSSSAYFGNFSVQPKMIKEVPGYVAFWPSKFSVAEIHDGDSLRFFQKVPGQLGRDLYDTEAVVRNGTEYLIFGSHQYMSEDAAENFPAEDGTIKIGENGLARWYISGRELSGKKLRIKVPGNGSYFIYDHSNDEMVCISSSYLVDGDREIRFPADGRIVFVGDPGAAFQIRLSE